MIVLGYVGNHAADSLSVRLGWAVTRLTQRGAFSRVTHVEGFYGFDGKGRALIASASLREGGVRVRYSPLDPKNWVAIDVPGWDVERSLNFIRAHAGAKYDLRGALATVFLNSHAEDRWFCNELVGASVGITSPEIFGPAQFMALALSMPGAKVSSILTAS